MSKSSASSITKQIRGFAMSKRSEPNITTLVRRTTITKPSAARIIRWLDNMGIPTKEVKDEKMMYATMPNGDEVKICTHHSRLEIWRKTSKGIWPICPYSFSSEVNRLWRENSETSPVEVYRKLPPPKPFPECGSMFILFCCSKDSYYLHHREWVKDKYITTFSRRCCSAGTARKVGRQMARDLGVKFVELLTL